MFQARYTSLVELLVVFVASAPLISPHHDLFSHIFHVFLIPSVLVKTVDTAEDTSVGRQRSTRPLIWALLFLFNVNDTHA